MAEKGSPTAPPGLVTPFKNAVVWESGKGNKSGVEFPAKSGAGSENRGK